MEPQYTNSLEGEQISTRTKALNKMREVKKGVLTFKKTHGKTTQHQVKS